MNEGVDVRATLEGIRLELERLRLQLQVINGSVAEVKLWRVGHDDHHATKDQDLARRLGIEEGRREVTARVDARDKWALGLQLSVLVALVTAVVNAILKVI